ESEPPRNRYEACSRIKRHVTVSGTGVPPVQALLLDVGRLNQRREDDHSGIFQKFVPLREQSDRIGAVFRNLEADHAVKAVDRLDRETRDEWIVRLDLEKTGGA